MLMGAESSPNGLRSEQPARAGGGLARALELDGQRARSVTVPLPRDLADFLIEFSIVLHKRSMYPAGHPHLQDWCRAVRPPVELRCSRTAIR